MEVKKIVTTIKDKVGLMINEAKVDCLHNVLDGCDNCSYNIDPFCVLRGFHCDKLRKTLK